MVEMILEVTVQEIVLKTKIAILKIVLVNGAHGVNGDLVTNLVELVLKNEPDLVMIT